MKFQLPALSHRSYSHSFIHSSVLLLSFRACPTIRAPTRNESGGGVDQLQERERLLGEVTMARSRKARRHEGSMEARLHWKSPKG